MASTHAAPVTLSQNRLSMTAPNYRLALYGLLAVGLFVTPLLAGPFALKLANTAAVTAIAAMGLTVLTGTAGLLSLGQAAFLAIGAFTGALMFKFLGTNVAVNVLAGGLVAALIGVVVASATVRTVGIYLAVGTFALQHVIELFLTDVEVKLTQAMGFQMPAPSFLGVSISTEVHWWIVLSINVLLVWAVLRWIVRGHVGRTWVLARDQPAVAATLGISVSLSRMAAFALCAFMGGTIGVLHGYYVGTVQVTNYSLHLSIVYLTVIVLGGPGRLGGAIWAAVLVTVLPHAIHWTLRQLGVDAIGSAAGVENIALGLILIGVLLGAPQRFVSLLRLRKPK